MGKGRKEVKRELLFLFLFFFFLLFCSFPFAGTPSPSPVNVQRWQYEMRRGRWRVYSRRKKKLLLRLRLNAHSKEFEESWKLSPPLSAWEKRPLINPSIISCVFVCVRRRVCVMTHLAVSPRCFISQRRAPPPPPRLLRKTQTDGTAAPLPLLLPHQDVITGLKAYRPDSNDIEWLDCVFWWISPWVIWRQIVFHFSYCCDFYLFFFFRPRSLKIPPEPRLPTAPPPSTPAPALPSPGRLQFVKAVTLSQRWRNRTKNTIFWLSVKDTNTLRLSYTACAYVPDEPPAVVQRCLTTSFHMGGQWRSERLRFINFHTIGSPIKSNCVSHMMRWQGLRPALGVLRLKMESFALC